MSNDMEVVFYSKDGSFVAAIGSEYYSNSNHSTHYIVILPIRSTAARYVLMTCLVAPILQSLDNINTSTHP